MLLFAAIFHLLGPAPGWFHLVAATMHVLATYLVYRLARETAGDQTLAAIAAGIFGLHPTKVETAAWISGLSDSLSLVFFLLSMIAYFQSRKSQGNRQRRHVIASVSFLCLALFSKEAAIFAPALIAIYEFEIAEPGFRNRCLAVVRSVWPFATVTLFAFGARVLLVHTHTGHLLNEIALIPTLLTAPRAILWYLEKQLWPLGLSVQYPIILVRSFSLSQFLLPLFVLIGTGTAAVIAVHKSATGIFFQSWFVLMLAPVILYHPNLQEHDRYIYFASVATSIGLAWLIVQLKRFGISVLAASIFALFAFMAALTCNYESYWDNDVKLFTRGVNIAPDNPNAVEYLASHYIDTHQHDKAEALARRLMDGSDQRGEGWYVLGTVLCAEERYEECRDAMQRAVELTHGKSLIRNLGLANADLKLGNNQEAALIYEEELKKYPDVAYFHGKLAVALKAIGKVDEAARETYLQQHLQ
jgi:tetratricopeptide (TPR) repeat protein